MIEDPDSGCTVNEPLTANNIDELVNCSIIEGHLLLLSSAFVNSTAIFDDKYKLVAQTRALDLTDLEKLNSVEVITDYLEIQAGDAPPINLGFLRNLRVVLGRRLAR